MRRLKTTSQNSNSVLAVGDKVTIFALSLFRRPSIEGQATIVGCSPNEADVYRVRFDGERKVRERFVFGGDWQHDPEAMLRSLLAHWRATLTPEILAEFFPDDDPSNGSGDNQ